MMRKKICMLGASAVGKTSLVKRFVEGIFSERYLTSVGVKIDRKTVRVGTVSVDLLLWDLNGEDRFQSVSMRYLRGAAGYLLVVDGTRKETLGRALLLHQRAQATLGSVPCVVVLNKVDLAPTWEVQDTDPDLLAVGARTVTKTSAKTGTGVEEAFLHLATALVQV